MGIPCRRVNGADLVGLSGFSISMSSKKQLYQWSGHDLNVDEVSVVWVRRWMDFAYFDAIGLPDDGGEDLAGEIRSYRQSEFRGLSHYFFNLLKDKPSLGSWFYSGKDPSKAQQLLLAADAGLAIPDTILTDSRQHLEAFMNEHPKIICKNISEIGFFRFSGRGLATYTAVIGREDLADIPDTFYPSLFQEAIEKQFEIRVFVLGEELYSMAIFSSDDSQTEVDFRRYNYARPNRTVPINLPSPVAGKIREFMRRAGLETGSLDLIYSRTGEYYFLEVNPGGQFSMVSIPCNYHLEKKVAEYLVKKSTHVQRTN